MQKKEAYSIIQTLENERTRTRHKGREILGFIMAKSGEIPDTLQTIAYKYLRNKDYQMHISEPELDVLIHVILEPNSGEEDPIIELWPEQYKSQ